MLITKHTILLSYSCIAAYKQTKFCKVTGRTTLAASSTASTTPIKGFMGTQLYYRLKYHQVRIEDLHLIL